MRQGHRVLHTRNKCRTAEKRVNNLLLTHRARIHSKISRQKIHKTTIKRTLRKFAWCVLVLCYMILLSLNNNLCRAFCGAKSATDTFFIINFCNVVSKGDCILRAIFGTESATDTSGVAIDLDSLSAVVIYTLNSVF
jgi:hypothetical protein